MHTLLTLSWLTHLSILHSKYCLLSSLHFPLSPRALFIQLRYSFITAVHSPVRVQSVCQREVQSERIHAGSLTFVIQRKGASIRRGKSCC